MDKDQIREAIIKLSGVKRILQQMATADEVQEVDSDAYYVLANMLNGIIAEIEAAI